MSGDGNILSFTPSNPPTTFTVAGTMVRASSTPASVVRNDSSFNVTMVPHDIEDVEYYLNGVFAIIVIFLGLIGNFLTVVVLTRRTMHSSTNFFLTALALWDMMVLLSTLLLITLPQLSHDYKLIVFPYIVVYIYPFALVAQTSTVWITVSFTVERYIAVCHPFKATTMCTIARARLVILIVSVCAVLYNLVRWFEYKLVDELRLENNKTYIITGIGKTEFGLNEVFKNIYFFYLYPFIMFIIPLSSLAILNMFLIMAVKRSQRQQKDMNVRQSRENNVTLMLVSVVIVFMMCQVPAMVYNVAYSINEAITTGYGWVILSSVRNFLVTFNSAINFILYCAFGQKFRRIFIRTFCRHLLSADDYNSITFHGATGTVTKLTNGTRKKYQTLLIKHKHSNNIEMSSNATQHTVISKYSPCQVKSVTPQMSKFQTGRLKVKDGCHHDMYANNSDSSDISCRNRLIVSSRTPSPL